MHPEVFIISFKKERKKHTNPKFLKGIMCTAFYHCTRMPDLSDFTVPAFSSVCLSSAIRVLQGDSFTLFLFNETDNLCLDPEDILFAVKQ